MKTKVIQNDPDGGAITGAPPPAAVPARPRRRGLVVAGALTAAIGAGALAGGAALVAVNETQRDAAGFYAPETAALATPRGRWCPTTSTSGTRAPTGCRPRAGSAGCGWPPPVRATDPCSWASRAGADVDAYLAGVSHALADLDGGQRRPTSSPGRARRRRPPPGDSGRSPPPGAGTQTVVWPVQEGDWSAVVMNADGSAGVRATTRVSVTTDVVLWLGVGMLLAGVALAGSGTALMLAGRPRAPA